MVKLNQIVAVVNGKKTETQKALTELHRKSQNAELFNGLSRTYRPLNDEDETYPNEGKAVQLTVGDVLEQLEQLLTNHMDVIATQDYANGSAVANVVVDGNTVLENVPVTYLLFLEKQLTDLHIFLSKLPVLDMSDTWTKDENRGVYVTQPYETNKTKKFLKHKVLYEATEHHPAQIEKWTEDSVIGKWISTKFSGAMPIKEKNKLVEKVKKLEEAVKFAREDANNTEVNQVHVGEKIFNYLLGE